MPDEKGRTTNYDMCSRPLDLSHLPEFAPLAHRPKNPFRDFFEWPDEAPPPEHAPHGPWLPVTCMSRTPKTIEPGHADPVWDVAFTTKFSKAELGEKPLVPHGTAPTFIPGLLPRAEEIEWLAATQKMELPTTLQELAANDMKGAILDADPELEYEAANIADTHLNRTPYAVRLSDETMLTEDGRKVSVPRFGDQGYINAMRRRIDWERFRSESPRPLRAYFTRGASDDIPDIDASSRMIASYTPEEELEAKRAVKRHWLRLHEGQLPNPLHLVTEATVKVSDILTEDDATAERLTMVEDPDPWRDAHHADPDPEPRREDYAEGDCTDRCVISPFAAEDDVHHECDQDGWDQYNMDWALWDKRHEKEYGYAGPDGDMVIDQRAPKKPENPFNLRTRVSSYGASY